jgi:putative DNA primase/helicase
MSMLGIYAMKAPAELLMASKYDRHPTEKADLHGRRLIAALETEQGRKLNEVLVKELTGGDPIRARRMREDFWEFWPTHKVFLATNHKPVITGTDHAIWERIRLIPFAVTIPRDRQDTTLPDKLLAELPGILAWAVQGCLIWQQEGLGEPLEVQQATASYRAEMDILGQFITECCHEGPEYKVRSRDLYNAYKAWSESNGEQAELSQHAFGSALLAKGYESHRSNGIWYRGLGLPVKEEELEA